VLVVLYKNEKKIMNLPLVNKLSTELLASCFNSTSATYKFYWLLAIIEEVENGSNTIAKHRLFTKMVTNAWYTVNYFKLSFGKQDMIHNAVEKIKFYEQLSIDENKDTLSRIIEQSLNLNTRKELNHFDKNVPHWFLSPWFAKLAGETDSQQKNRIHESSQKFQYNCLYALYKNEIIINPDWIEYLQKNAKLIKDYCYWNLTLFLQTRNPSVPDIANKLIKPATRNSLTTQRNNYWKNVFLKDGFVNCIFTNKKLYFEENNYALDHFVPHAFVSHDLIWNLIPICGLYNLSKSDKLPNIKKHFDKFFLLQKNAFTINKEINSRSKYMDEYLTIFPDLNDFSKSKFKDTIQPLITIAHNNGFSYIND
jgi:HNH endonuclease